MHTLYNLLLQFTNHYMTHYIFSSLSSSTAATRDLNSISQSVSQSVRVRVTLRLMVICFHSPYVASSLTRGWVCSLQLLLALASAVILRSDSRGFRDHILLSETRDSPNLEGQVPVFTSHRNRVTQLYPQALGSLFVASYDSKG
jgi:hypothetical protein